MSFLERLRKRLSSGEGAPLFEIKDGTHTRFITLGEWRERQKAYSHFLGTIGGAKKSGELVRIHESKNHERKTQ